jgi:hypothetical protein
LEADSQSYLEEIIKQMAENNKQMAENNLAISTTFAIYASSYKCPS